MASVNQGVKRNGPLFHQHASPEAIMHQIALARRRVAAEERELRDLIALLEWRQTQIAAGEWPEPAGTEPASATAVDPPAGAVTA